VDGQLLRAGWVDLHCRDLLLRGGPHRAGGQQRRHSTAAAAREDTVSENRARQACSMAAPMPHTCSEASMNMARSREAGRSLESSSAATVDTTVAVEDGGSVPNVPASSSSVTSSDALHSVGVAFSHLLFAERQITGPFACSVGAVLSNVQWQLAMQIEFAHPYDSILAERCPLFKFRTE
jgi:hypothetical protein